MNEWSFLRSPRWAGYLALVIVFAIACCALGTWQLNRRAEALAEVARIDANYDAEADPGRRGAARRRRRSTSTSGGRSSRSRASTSPTRRSSCGTGPFEGSSGFEVITPFRLDDGTVFMVDRGWIAQAPTAGRASTPRRPSGHVEVDGAAEGGRGAHRRAHVHRHRVRDDRPRRARRAGRRAELHRRVRRARAVRRRRRRAAARRGAAGARRGPAPLVRAAVVRLRAARVRRARLGREPGATRARGGIRSRRREAGTPRGRRGGPSARSADVDAEPRGRRCSTGG